MTKRTKIILWSLGGFVFLLCAIGTIYLIVLHEPDLANGREGGSGLPGKQLLVASSGSAFKQQLLKELEHRLLADKIPLKVIPLRELPGIDPAACRAVVLLNSCEMGKMDSRVEAFLAQHRDYARTVLVTTSGGGLWKTKKFAIDTVSGASKRSVAPSLAETIMSRVRRIGGAE
jgi:hypothetical protein